jgi:hypothetical protein
LGTKTFTLPAGTVIDKAGNSLLKVTKPYSVIAATEEPAEEPGTVYPQQWATGTGTVGDPWTNGCVETAYAACPTGGTIYLRAGYYLLTGAFEITKSINIIGEGIDKTFIVTDNTDGIWVEADHVTFKGFTVDGDAQTLGSYSCFNLGGDYFVLEDIEVKNAGYYGIATMDSSYGYYNNIYAHDNYRHGYHPVADTAGKNVHNTWQNIYAWDNGVNGFDAVGGRDDPEFERYNVYDNIQCWDNGNTGIALQYSTGAILSNSFATGNGGAGMWLDTIKDLNVHDCSITLNGEDGISLNSSTNVYFANVIAKNNNTTDTQYASGFVVRDCTDIKLTSCQSYDDRATLLQYFGIQVEGTTDYVELMGCELMPNKISAVYNGSGAVIAVIPEKMLAKF